MIIFFGKQYRLAEFLGKSNGNISQFKNGSNFVPLDIIHNILKLLPETKRKEYKILITENLKEIRHKAGTALPIKIKFPIKFSVALARIAGHLAGDGGINAVNRTFYSNKSRCLIELFKQDMEMVFGKVSYNEYERKSCIIIFFPTITGIILKAFFGKMRNEHKNVPLQVLNSSDIHKCLFLRALFDDEGNVNIEKATVQINMTNKSIIENCKRILASLGIIAGKVSEVNRTGNRKNLYLFRISGREHLKLFFEKINFDHPDKKAKLEELIKSYARKKIIYGKAWLTRQLILQILNKYGEATKCQIAKELNRSSTSLKYHLLNLEDEKIICSRREGLIKIYFLSNMVKENEISKGT